MRVSGLMICAIHCMRSSCGSDLLNRRTWYSKCAPLQLPDQRCWCCCTCACHYAGYSICIVHVMMRHHHGGSAPAAIKQQVQGGGCRGCLKGAGGGMFGGGGGGGGHDGSSWNKVEAKSLCSCKTVQGWLQGWKPTSDRSLTKIRPWLSS